MIVGEESLEGFKQTEIGLLPADWELEKLGNAIKTIKGKKPRNLNEYYNDGATPYLTAEYYRRRIPKQFVRVEDKDSYIGVHKNDIVLIWDGSNAGDVFTGLEGALASTMIRIEPKHNNFCRQYIYYYLKSKFDLFNSKTTGSTIPHVNKHLFENLSLPLPHLLEQQKIASVLSSIQEAKDKTENVIYALKELKKSMMKHLFTYGAVPIEDAERVPLHETEIGLIPEHWEIKELGTIAGLIQTGPFGSQLHAHEYIKNGIPVINPSNLQNGGIVPDIKCTISEEKAALLPRHVLRQGDIIFGRRGEMGRCALVTEKEQGWICGTGSLNVRIDQRGVQSKYVCHFLRTEYVKKWLLDESVGSTMNNLNTEILSRLKIPLPSFREQCDISDLFSKIHNQMLAEQNKQYSLSSLFKTLLSLLMKGRIRVKDLEIPV